MARPRRWSTYGPRTIPRPLTRSMQNPSRTNGAKDRSTMSKTTCLAGSVTSHGVPRSTASSVATPDSSTRP